MSLITIPELPSYPVNILQNDSLFEVVFFNGTEYVSHKISGLVIKNAIGGTIQWGQITGNIVQQTDLNNALNSKFNIPNGNIGQYINGLGALVQFPDIPAAQVNSDWNAVTGVSAILNKPSFALVAFSGEYDDLLNKPTIPAAQVNSDWNAVTGVAAILNKPTIPAAQVNSDWNATTGVEAIINKPTALAPTGSAGGDLTGTYPNPTIKQSVGLTGIPTAPTASFPSETNQIANTAWVTAYVDGLLQPFIPVVSGTEFRRGIIALNGSNNLVTLGGISSSQVGTAVAITVTPSSASPYPRVRYSSTTGTNSSVVSNIISSGVAYMCRKIGYRFTCVFSPSDVSTTGVELYAPSARQFYGVVDSTTPIGINSSTTVQSIQQMIGVGSDSGDENLHIFHNDGNGNANRTDLGENFPAGKTSAVPFTLLYCFELYALTNTNEVRYRVTQLNNGFSVEGTITTNLPDLTARAIPQAVRTSGLSASNVSIDIGNLTISSFF